ncbi:pentapeptide repeat-containing protein [Nocardia sp. NPDC050406]|uniref:pentapeptide repeat-containing protein n=1 Tax=Nocardia sp. NPDC050406 TaxID=3364318 RepID=UPI003787A817
MPPGSEAAHRLRRVPMAAPSRTRRIRLRPNPGPRRRRLLRPVQALFTWDGWAKVGALATAVAAIGALVFTNASLRVSAEQQRLAAQGQVAERFTRAGEMLGDDSSHVRMGGLYLLEQLARDSERYRRESFEVIGAFVRDTASLRKAPCAADIQIDPEAKPPRAPVEVQAALTIIGRRTGSIGHEIDIAHTCLAGADLRGAQLSDALLDGSVLARARLTGANLHWADLRGADLRGVDADDVVVPNSDVALDSVVVDLSAAFLSGADLSGASFRMADFHEAFLTGAILRDASMPDTNATDTHWSKADMSGVFLMGSDFGRALLDDTRFVGAQLREVSFVGASMRGADLTDAHLGGADLRGADLTGATLTGADFGGEQYLCVLDDFSRETCATRPEPWAVYDDTTRWPAGFTPSWTSPLPRAAG